MAAPPPSTQPQPQPEPAAPLAISLPQASYLLVAFTDFLTVAIHNILFYRALYPPATFLTARAYNLAVHQSRHPRVCGWVRDAVDAVKAQLVRGAVSRIAVVIHHPASSSSSSRSPSGSSGDESAKDGGGSNNKTPGSAVLERWMLDVAAFPAFAGVRDPPRGSSRRDAEDDGMGVPEARCGDDEGQQQQQQQQRDGTVKVNWTDVDEAFRGAVRRMALAAERLGPLPEGCSFTVAVELRDEGEAPIGVSFYQIIFFFSFGETLLPCEYGSSH
jgi:mitotic spindle assembly checkpoint protein MAD2B